MADRVLGVLAGRDLPLDHLRAWADSSDLILAADGGANTLLDIGIAPDVIVGDMDSVKASALSSGAEIVTVPGQDQTDCDKLLQLAVDRGIRALTLVGVEGDRFDHIFATLHSVLASGLEVTFGLRMGLGKVVDSAGFSIQTKPSRIFSFFPLSACKGVDLSGVEWPLAGASLSPGEAISISNRSNETTVRLGMSSGFGLATWEVPLDELPQWPTFRVI